MPGRGQQPQRLTRRVPGDVKLGGQLNHAGQAPGNLPALDPGNQNPGKLHIQRDRRVRVEGGIHTHKRTIPRGSPRGARGRSDVRPMTVHPLNPPRPGRLSALDIVALTDVEVRAALLHIAGHPDPAVGAAAAETVREVLEHTRPGTDPADVLGYNRVKLDRDP